MTDNRLSELLLIACTAWVAAACTPGADTPPASMPKTDTPMDANARQPAARTETQPTTPPAIRQAANATPSDDGRLDVQAGGARISIEGCRFTWETATVARCEGDTHIVLTHEGTTRRVMVTSLYIDSAATFYRGPLDEQAPKPHSFVLTDVDGDGHDDLIVWTGREGAYGGPSYDVALFDPATGEFAGAPAFSELTVGANGLFAIEAGNLKLSSTEGCCTRYFDTYIVEQREPKLVERITEEREQDSDAVRRKVERLVAGQMKQVT